MSFRLSTLKQNLGYKLLALGFAISLATSVYHQPVQEFVVEIGVNLTGLPEHKIFVGEAPANLVIRLQGPESELLDLARRSKDLRYDIDLGNILDDQELVFDPHHIEKLLRTRQVQVAGIRPRLLQVEMENKLEREVPVQVEYAGMPREGFRHDPRKSQVLPSTVLVTGPESQVSQIHLVKTKAVPLNGLDHPSQFEQPLIRPKASFVQLSPNQVRVEVVINEELRSQKLDALPIEIIGCPKSFRCTAFPSKVWLIAHGPFRAMERLKASPPDKVQVSIPPNSKGHELRLNSFLPHHEQGVNVQFEPPSVDVRLESLTPPTPVERTSPNKE